MKMTHYQDLYLARVPGKAYGQLIGFLSDHIYNFQLLVLYHHLHKFDILQANTLLVFWNDGILRVNSSGMIKLGFSLTYRLNWSFRHGSYRIVGG